MNRTLKLAALIVFAVITISSAFGVTAPAVTLSDGGGNTATIDATGTVTFGGSCTVPTTCSTMSVSVAPGQVVWLGKLGAFTISAIAGLTKPVLTGAPAVMDLSLQGIQTTSGGTITIRFGDTGFTQTNVTSMTMKLGGLISAGSGSIVAKAYADDTNTLFGTGHLIGTIGPLTGPTLTGTATGTGPTVAPFSLMEEVVATMGPNSAFGIDFELDIQTGPEEEIACRYTGGGVDTNYNWDHTLADGNMITNGAGKLPPGIDRYQYGGQVGAPTAADPQPWGEWQHSQQRGPSGSFNFHAGTASAAPGTRIVDVRCSDPGFCNPARHAPAKQLDWDGIGTFSNVGSGAKAPVWQIPANVIPEPNGGSNKLFTFHWVEVNIDDMGERGSMNTGAPDPAVCPGRGFGEKSGGPFVPDPVNAPNTIINLLPTPLGHCDCPDFYRITIYNGVRSDQVVWVNGKIDPASLDRTNVIYEVFGYVDGGNLQIHPPTSANK
ncbi:MAG TPA: hypothetical protein VN577_15800 [Terriglobales bacterium]|nr:hypothetical protein [Terriglobales bacterium]